MRVILFSGARADGTAVDVIQVWFPNSFLQQSIWLGYN